ncbi:MULTISPECIES: class I SAM-dependent methyltransferase [unclassified Streptomyces]|uniref:class I SAM-dependent methyltransferase n=1 Tax=unclassified Streptomyces TaxID=2593676 RepID=UPI0027419BEB|nr:MULTISPECIES: class I SAM-dependent methyltransferase [unclassified Streptomyces]
MVESSHWGAVEPLLLAVGARDEHLRAAIAEVGVEQAAAVAVDEVLARYGADGPWDPVRLHLRLHHDGRFADYTLQVDRREMLATPGAPDDASVSVTYELRNLLKQLFGPRADSRPAPPKVEFTWPQAPIPELAQRMGPVVQGLDALLAACSPADTDLGRLAVRFGSDKWGGVHWYTRHYERHMRALRDAPVRILEIGVGGYSDNGAGGASLHMWQRYFRRGLVLGLDLFRKPEALGPRIRTLQGDQNDPEQLTAVAEEHGPFDIVIDDGSHVNEHVRTSFDTLFPYVREGGLYVIEDVQTSYWPGYGGTPDAAAAGDGTTLGLMTSLVDLMHHREYAGDVSGPRSYAADHTVGVHHYHNIVFVEKGPNNEEPSPAWIPRSPFPTA